MTRQLIFGSRGAGSGSFVEEVLRSDRRRKGAPWKLTEYHHSDMENKERPCRLQKRLFDPPALAQYVCRPMNELLTAAFEISSSFSSTSAVLFPIEALLTLYTPLVS
uniref:Uncharacterized protein n=1 Tax=Haemonchus contortus TaxID=6289 RepID=A0A7I4Y3C9_HAECO